MYSGLADPVLDSQRVFRAVMDAMAHPGRVSTVPAVARVPAPLSVATAAVALTLLDFETPLWLDGSASAPTVRDYLRFHSGCPVVVKPERARFALIADPLAMTDWAVFDAGTDEYPDRSTTLIVQVDRLAAGSGRRLSGPGIAGHARLDVGGVTGSFWDALRRNHAQFPRGVDLILTSDDRVAALPRTTRVDA
jgi:alpha-D-ribose 1-methylphosphonate 5-triphosphate synthase subunit PhnH